MWSTTLPKHYLDRISHEFTKIERPCPHMGHSVNTRDLNQEDNEDETNPY